MSTKVNVTEYARHRGCDRAAVYRAIRSKRLVESAEKVAGEWAIDLELADDEWRRNTRKVGGDRRSERFRTTGVETRDVEALRRDGETNGARSDTVSEADLARIQYRDREASAQWKETRAAKLAGTLVDKAEQEAEYRRIAAMIHDAIRTTSRRIGPRVAVESNAARCSRMIEDAMFSALEDVCSDHDRDAGGPAT